MLSTGSLSYSESRFRAPYSPLVVLGTIICSFSRLAAEYGLHPIYKKEFHEVFEEFQEHSEFKPLLQRMNVIDANGETEMDEGQWEAASTLSFLVLSADSQLVQQIYMLHSRWKNANTGRSLVLIHHEIRYCKPQIGAYATFLRYVTD